MPTPVQVAAQAPPIAAGMLQETTYVHSGEVETSAIDFDAGGRAGWNVVFRRNYRSRTLYESPLGVGWDSPIFRRLRLLPTNEVEYRDTGIILSVKPRVAANGGVAMTIEQEISSVTGGAGSLTPVISNRRVASSISVADGQTVLLGGLISELANRGRSGIPGLHRLKGIGALFGSRATNGQRNELIILIRPSVIRDSRDAQHVAEELRTKLWSLGATQAR